jgi:hypothetical protein
MYTGRLPATSKGINMKNLLKTAAIFLALSGGLANANGINGCFIQMQSDPYGHISYVQVCPR